MMPPGVSSIMRLHTVWMNSWSWLDMSITPLKFWSVLLNACIDSRSRWLVGESSTSVLASVSIIFAIMQRIFSPPDSTDAFLSTSSPEKSILPRNPLRYISDESDEYWHSQSTRFRSDSKNLLLSSGRYALVMVCPQEKSPVSAWRLPMIISKRAVMARGSRDRKATLSPFSIWKFTSEKSTSPSMDAFSPFTSRILLPTSLDGVNMIPG